ncbi:Zinc finger protein 836 [Eumeta japonica]|uniref:Zinc finger protein 836 n=1 Tax=Eumeta variegata TaxID=151549 RepID=A0A4C1UL94_EUMVA|nr:Zinc finger protein 836 [Eumeta japonica]
MNRQIDVRALVSHIVSGDGMDRCRICMGDTAEGQVFLSDTVMLEDDRPITLSELLETVTGIEVGVQDLLPGAVCSDCVGTAMRAAEFQDFCRESISMWHRTLSNLQNLPLARTLRKGTKGIFAIMRNDNVQIVNDQTGELQNEKEAAVRLEARLYQIKYGGYRNELIRQGKRCKCPDCGKQFFYAYHLYHHLSQGDVDHWACPFCAEIMSRDMLVDHLSVAHNRIPHPCRNCPAILKSKEGLTHHNQKCHASAGVIRERNITKSAEYACYCDICKKKFSNKKSLTAHMRHIHLKNMLRTCPHCPKTMPSAYLNQHLKSHKIIKEFICNHCGLSLKTRLGHLQHLRLHTGEKPYLCKICGEAFSSSSRRSEHMKKHKGPDETFLKHACPYCPAKFRLPYRLRGHVEAEAMLPPSVCSGCSAQAVAAGTFAQTCRRSASRWTQIVDRLYSLDELARPGVQTIYALLKEEDLVLLRDSKPAPSNKTTAVQRLNKVIPKSRLQNQRDPTGFVCPECDMSFSTIYSLNRHLRETTLRACGHCNRILDKSDLMKHFSEHGLTPHVCLRCNDVFDDRHQLLKHLRLNHGPGSRACRECGRKFKDSLALSKHAECHGVRECKGCGRVFIGRKCYVYHRSHCDKLKAAFIEYICDDCGKIYSSKMALIMHMKLAHLYGWQVQCSTCGKRLQSTAQLKEHENTHNRVYRYTCEYCGLKMSTRRGYQKHVAVHVVGKPHACPHCDFRTNVSSLLVKHLKVRHDESKEYVCELCTVRFNQVSHLRCHMMTKHTESTFICPTCNKNFPSRKKMLDHQKEHSLVRSRRNAVVVRKVSMKPVEMEIVQEETINAFSE